MGIGRAVALRFAEEKARIVLAHYDPDESESNATLKALSERGVKAESHKADVSSFGAVDSLFRDILSRFGRIDVLVNNAGITRDTLLMRMSEEVWDTVIGVNLKSVFNCTKAVVMPMIKKKSGRIVNISSVVGQIGNAGQANYAASKGGEIAMSKTLARELGKFNINVNVVAPGMVMTEMARNIPPEFLNKAIDETVLGRIASPEDCANVVVFLCSRKARHLTGEVIKVDGGQYI